MIENTLQDTKFNSEKITVHNLTIPRYQKTIAVVCNWEEILELWTRGLLSVLAYNYWFYYALLMNWYLFPFVRRNQWRSTYGSQGTSIYCEPDTIQSFFSYYCELWCGKSYQGMFIMYDGFRWNMWPSNFEIVILLMHYQIQHSWSL